MAKKFLTAYWQNLIMANYEIEPQALTPHLPVGTELDLWNNHCYVSLVGFQFLKTNVLGLPIPFHRNFPEVNLRFYVRYKAEDGWRRGVVFVKEIVPKPMITFIANQVYGEHYRTLAMKHLWKKEKTHQHVAYYWKFQKEWNFIKVNTSTKATAIPSNSEAEFITEHYWGYTKIKDQLTSQYQVEHPRWEMYVVKDYEIHCAAKVLYGPEFGECMNTAPISVFMAKGSEVTVRRAGKLKL